MEALLLEAGAIVIGPAATLAEGSERARREQLDAAILDFRLSDSTSEEIAHILSRRGVPFLFYSGHLRDAEALTRWLDRPVLSKPVSPSALIDAVAGIARQ